jgi:hypothetical protein
VTNQYNSGRVTAFSDREIERMMERFLPEEWERNGNSSSEH